jgi:predicted nucleic acid-binding protein
MTTYVLDASVAAKWFLPAAGETLLAESLEILRDFTAGRIGLLVPDLFWPEFGNTLWKAVRTRQISRGFADEAMAIMEQLAPKTAPTAPLVQAAFSIAAAFHRTVYDSVYVALALDSGRLLVTADEHLANALAARFPIRWLGAYSPA